MYFFWEPKWRFCKGYSLCLVADFGNFQNALICRILAVFLAVFCIEQLQCVLETFSVCFFAFLVFVLKWGFCIGYRLCLVAIFGNFQNSFIFRILAFFSSRFLHRTTAMCSWNLFRMCSWIFNFWPKVTILQGQEPRLLARAIACAWWPFLAIFKMLSFVEYYLFFRALFYIEQLQCVVETFLACFFAFLIFDIKWGFCKGYSLCLVAIFGNFQNALICRIWAFFFQSFFA